MAMTLGETEGISSSEEREQQEWTYIGERLEPNEKIVHMWLDNTGKERAFSKSLAKNPVVGSVYLMTVTESGASVFTGGPSAPKFLKFNGSAENLPIWRAEHEATRTALAARREQNKIRKEHKGDLGNMTLKEAALWYRGSWSGQERSGKLATLLLFLEHGDLQ